MKQKTDFDALAAGLLQREKTPLPQLTSLSRAFYQRTAIQVAQELLGKYLALDRPGFPQALCRIVETEAYMGKTDRAAHSSGGKRTARTEILYGPGGGVYIYLIYGMYACLNIVCNRPEIPQAALIRAVEPVRGIEGLCQARFGCTVRELIDGKGSRAIVQLANGPGKLCKALHLTKEDSGIDLFHSFFHILEEKSPVPFQGGLRRRGRAAALPVLYRRESLCVQAIGKNRLMNQPVFL